MIMNGRDFLKKIYDEMGKVIVGYRKEIKLITVSLLSEGHVLIEGPPGIGKTTLSKNFAQLLGLNFSRIQMTPDLLPSDIIGYSVYNLKIGETKFIKGPIVSNIVLLDEINRGSPKTQSALLEVMEEKAITIEGKQEPLVKPFMVIATMNPYESEGVYLLPEAELDRFMIKLYIDYPSNKGKKKGINIEKNMLLRKHKNHISKVSKLFDRLQLLDIINYINTNIKVGECIIDYIAEIAYKTRSDERLDYGISPRVSEHLLYASKAMAYLNGRDYVIPDDVKHLCPYMLPHRMKINIDYEIDGLTTTDVVKDILNSTEIPIVERCRN